jgi:arylsulfatase A-like enzyme
MTSPIGHDAPMTRLPAAFLLMSALIGFFVPTSDGQAEPSRPNVVLILADDMGWGDPQCYNPESRIPTPHLDRLAEEGMRFTDAHTPSSVCTPTHYGLLTGRYCWRTWLKKSVLDGFGPPLIEPGQTTLASFLQGLGYVTACVGKWHIGMQWTTKDGQPVQARSEGERFRPGSDIDFQRPIQRGPLACGFDEFFGISASLDMSPYCFIEGDRTVGIPTLDSPEDRDGPFMNQVAGLRTPDFALEGVLPAFKARAIRFIEDHAEPSGQPFFLYLPLNSPHLPVVPNEAFRGTSGIGAYGDFVVETDDCIGAVLEALDRSGVTDETLVLVTSDNGGLWHAWEPAEADDVSAYKPSERGGINLDAGHRSNAHLRGTKADIWEGGHRVPFIVRWPETVSAGQTSDALVCLTDVLATLSAITGKPLPKEAGEDSRSFLGALRGDSDARETVVHHSLHGGFALRKGPWKLCLERGSQGFSRPRFIDPKPGEPEGQLYHIGEDPAETRNLWLEKPDVVRELEAELDALRIETP